MVEETTPDWLIPKLPRPTPSRIIRGLSPIQAGAARAIPAPEHGPTMTTVQAGIPPNKELTTCTSNETLPPREGDLPEVIASTGSAPELSGSTHIPCPAFLSFEPNTNNLYQPDAVPPAVSPAGLPDGDLHDVLRPLPPGWVQNQGFSLGLHPTDDVLDVADEVPTQAAAQSGETPQQEHDAGGSSPPLPDPEPQSIDACDKGEQNDAENEKVPGHLPACEKGDSDEAPNLQEGAHPKDDQPPPEEDDLNTTSGEENATDDGYMSHGEIGQNPSSCRGGVPEPQGEPSRLTAQQRARLHELLRSGHLPQSLDSDASDEQLWKAYRQETTANYRAMRKRKRADGSWTKDDERGWGPPRPGQAKPQLHRERSPLPRRRPPST